MRLEILIYKLRKYFMNLNDDSYFFGFLFGSLLGIFIGLGIGIYFIA